MINRVPSSKSRFVKLKVLLLAVAVVYFGCALRSNPFFNDENYTNLVRDLDRTLELPAGSPEQAVAYMKLGKHLEKPIYGGLTGMDVLHWVRDPENPLRPLLRRHDQLKKDWDTKDSDGLSNADHYQGFVKGPVSGARTLFQESAPEHLDRLNELLEQMAGADPETLDLAGQESLLQQVFERNPEGRKMIQELTSRRLLDVQAQGYRKLAVIAGSVGTALRWLQSNGLGLVILVLLVRRLGRRSLPVAQPGIRVPKPRFAHFPSRKRKRRAARPSLTLPARKSRGLPSVADASGSEKRRSLRHARNPVADQLHRGFVDDAGGDVGHAAEARTDRRNGTHVYSVVNLCLV